MRYSRVEARKKRTLRSLIFKIPTMHPPISSSPLPGALALFFFCTLLFVSFVSTQEAQSSSFPAGSVCASISSRDWSTAYDGYGEVVYNGEKGVLMQPKTSTTSSETHAALVLTNLSNFTSFKLTCMANTIKQLRENSPPNAWEVFWLFFNYVPTSENEKNTNYFILKVSIYLLSNFLFSFYFSSLCLLLFRLSSFSGSTERVLPSLYLFLITCTNYF